MIAATDKQCAALRRHWAILTADQRKALLDAARSIEGNPCYCRNDVAAIAVLMVLMMDGAVSAVVEG